jgi:hypothetical protein
MTLLTFILGIVTVFLSLVLPGNVFSIAIDSVSKIGAGLAGPVIIKALRWKHSGFSLLLSIVTGIGAAFIWKELGYSATFNEVGIGLACSLAVNWALARIGHHSPKKSPSAQDAVTERK